MAATYKARFNQITRPEIAKRTMAESLLLSGLSRAIDMRKHRAAYHLGSDIGMLATAKSGGDKIDPMAFYDLVAAVITHDGTVITEHHSTSGIGDVVRPTPCGSYGSHCKAYMLPKDGGELTALGDFTSHPDDAFSLAYGFDDSLSYAMSGAFFGATALPSEGRKIAMNIFSDAEHHFASPIIERFVSLALTEAL